jgi:hypothetical protein
MDNSAPSSVEFDVRLTPADYAAVTLLVADTPAARRLRWRASLSILALVPLGAILVAYILWALDPDHAPLADVIGVLPGILSEKPADPDGLSRRRAWLHCADVQTQRQCRHETNGRRF